MLFPRKRNSKRKTYSIIVPSEQSADGLVFQERFKKRKEKVSIKNIKTREHPLRSIIEGGDYIFQLRGEGFKKKQLSFYLRVTKYLTSYPKENMR